MSKLELGRVHMTVKVMDDKVEYRPKEGMMSASYPKFEFNKDEWNRMVGTAEDGMVIEYEEISSSTSTSKGGEGAVPEGGFSHPYTKCKIVNVVKPLAKAEREVKGIVKG